MCVCVCVQGGGVSLRTRSPRRYNEDSEEDSIAAISKRTPHHHHHLRHQRRLASRRRRHLAVSGVTRFGVTRRDVT